MMTVLQYGYQVLSSYCIYVLCVCDVIYLMSKDIVSWPRTTSTKIN
jgi:hypothetical protein